MGFSGVNDCEGSDIIKSFYSCKQPEAVEQVANEFCLQYRSQQIDENRVITFKNNPNLHIQPLFWVSLSESYRRDRGTLSIEFDEKIFGSYCYVLMIDAYKGERQAERNNIDCGRVIFRGIYLDKNLIKTVES